jgi:hypothetical protein
MSDQIAQGAQLQFSHYSGPMIFGCPHADPQAIRHFLVALSFRQ